MKNYKILVFKHLLKNNKIAKKGDVVKESQLINVDHSVKGKFVEEVKSSKKPEAKKSEAKK
jgi:hypothetical protein